MLKAREKKAQPQRIPHGTYRDAYWAAYMAAQQSLWLMFALFALHRAFTLSPLSYAFDLTRSQLTQAILVGLFSDFWISGLFSLLVFILALLLQPVPRTARFLGWLAFAVCAFGVAAHQSYVDFFRFQLMPFHIQYLTDIDFIKADGPSVLTLKGACTLGVAMLSGWLWVKVRPWPGPSELQSKSFSIRSIYTLLGLWLLALMLHNRNIHYRVQWFVPEPLQMNLLEHFYMVSMHSRRTPPLSPAETDFLAKQLHIDPASLPQNPAERLLVLVTKDPNSSNLRMQEPAPTLKQNFQTRAKEGRKPILAVLLMESLRPAETGYFAPSTKPSLTPHLDALVKQGLVFTRAYSTGSVTRGGQEATLCGYRGSRDTSIMRGQSLYNFPCLPDELQLHPSTLGPIETFWYHGGEGRFDNQLNFWRHKGVVSSLSQKDFPAKVARTSWGVGDHTFLDTAARSLLTRHQQTSAVALTGLLLTVSHHIPWDIPADAPRNLSSDTAGLHPSYRTTRYFDAALGNFVDQLKETHLWDDTLLILVSDHGNTVPPYNEIYGSDPLRYEYLQSHINLLLTGGIVDQSLQQLESSNKPVLRQTDVVVSQAAVAGFINYILDLPQTRSMAEPLFTENPTMPVLADLEMGLYSPSLRRHFSRMDLVEGNSQDFNTEDRTALLYYRAFLQLINQADKAASANDAQSIRKP